MRLLFALGFVLAACVAPAVPPTLTPAPSTTLAQLPSLAPSATPTVQPSPTPIPLSGLCPPLAGHSFAALLGYISQPFRPPPSQSDWDGGHHGLDFAYYQRNDAGGQGGHVDGAPLQSMLDARVAGVGYASIYGHYLVSETPWAQLPAELAALFGLTEGQSLYLLYAHLQAAAPFTPGERLACGQAIGAVGASGDAYFVVEAHLHFETRVAASGIALGPMTYYTAEASQAEQDEYRRWRNSPDFLLYDPLPLFALGASQE